MLQDISTYRHIVKGFKMTGGTPNYKIWLHILQRDNFHV